MHFLHLTAALLLNAESAVGTAKLSATEASGIVEAFRLQQEQKSKGEKAVVVKSVDDVIAVLKRDELAQFDDAAEFAKTQTTPDAKALRAQIELAWGDAQTMVADLLERTNKDLSAGVAELEEKKKTAPLQAADQARYEDLLAATKDLGLVIPALRQLAQSHLDEGGKGAAEIIKSAPKSYLGYRVAADFYRMKGDWKKFDEMKKKLESTNPKSNGLVFLKGIEQLDRHKKPEEAAKFFREALKNDPKFTRAQAMLVLLPGSIEDTYKEYKALEELSPFHQIAVWVGPRIEAARNEALFAKKK